APAPGAQFYSRGTRRLRRLPQRSRVGQYQLCGDSRARIRAGRRRAQSHARIHSQTKITIMNRHNNNIRRLSMLLLVVLAALPFGRALAQVNTASAEAGTLNLLFIGHSQREGSGYHLSHLYAPVFNQSLGREKIRMEYHEDLALLTPEGLAQFDAVMLYGNYDHLTKEQESALVNYVETGGAFLPIPSASACFGHSDTFVKLVGGRFHSPGLETFTTRIAPGQENHPILRGFTGFETRDETYVHRDHNEQGRTVLMLREDEPWTWVRQQGKGRV